MVDYVREMTAKKSCKHGEYGLFEHFFFLLNHALSVYEVAQSYRPIASLQEQS